MYLLASKAWSRDWKLSYVTSSVGTLVFHSWLLYLHFWVGRPVCPFLSFVIEIGNWKLPFDILFVKVCACRARYFLFGLLDDCISSPDASWTKTEKFQRTDSKQGSIRPALLPAIRPAPVSPALAPLRFVCSSFSVFSFRFQLVLSEWLSSVPWVFNLKQEEFQMNSCRPFLYFEILTKA